MGWDGGGGALGKAIWLHLQCSINKSVKIVITVARWHQLTGVDGE